jgi:hypothetical protein
VDRAGEEQLMLDLQPLYYGTSTFTVGRFGVLGTLPAVPQGLGLIYDLDFQHTATSTDLSNAGYSFSRTGSAWDEFGNSFSSGTPRIVPGKGLLIEGSRTNSVRNSTMVGVAAGTPGTLPTNWTASAATGLSHQVVGTGTLGGLTYLDLRVYGTAGSTAATGFSPEAATQIVASSGQTWTASWYMALVGGSLNNVTALRFDVTERNSGGSAVQTTNGSDIKGSLTTSLQRFSLTRTLTDATTVGVLTSIRGAVTNGAAVDYTLRLAAPQIESGAHMSSPILTSGSAATRNGESCIRTIQPSFMAQGTVLVEYGNPAGGTARTFLLLVTDSGNSRWNLRSSDGGSYAPNLAVGDGTANTTLVGTAYAVGTGQRAAAAWTGSRSILAHNGTLTAAGNGYTSDGTTQLVLGGTSDNAHWGYIRRIRHYAAVFTDSNLQLATADFDLNLAYDATANDLAAAGFATTRATAAWDELGRSYTSDTPRVVPGRGLLVEGARTNLVLRSQEFDNAAWTKSSVTVTANDAIAPDGTLTADKLTESGSGAITRPGTALTVTAATNYTVSFYARRSNFTWLRVLVGDDSAFTNRIAGWFDLLNGVKGSVVVNGAVTSGGSTMTAIGGGWYRCAIVFSMNSATTAFPAVVSASADASTTRADVGGGAGIGGIMHVWQAQVVASSFVGTPIATTSAAVTRNVDAIVATRAAGLLDRGSALVRAALAPGSDSGVQQMLLTLHDGTVNNRLSLYRSTATSALTLYLGAGGVQQASLGGGAGSANALAISGGAGRWATDNTAWSVNGGAVTVDAVATVPAMTSEQLGARNGNAEPLYGYLRRIKRTTTLLTDAELQAASNGYDLSFALGATAVELSGSGWSFSRAGTAYDLWGNSYPANQPRIVPGRGLLLETGARTNQVLQSNTFSSGSWTKTEMTLTAAAGISPDGTANAWSMVESANSASRTMQSSVSFTSGTTYCFSCYYKPLPGSATRYARILLPAVAFGASSLGANFDTNTGAATNVGAGVTTPAVSIGGGWWRFAITATAVATSSNSVIIGMSVNTLGTTNYAGDGASGLLVWQAQCEAGVFASTPIPTTSSTVTRAADVLTAARTAGLLTTGSVLLEATTASGVDASVNAGLYAAYIDAATYLWVYRGTSRAIGVDSQGGGQAFATVADRTHLRLAMTWTSTGYRACLNGGTVQAGTGSGAFTTEALGDLPPYGRPSFGYVRRIARTGESWSDAQLKAFTYGAVL